MTFIEKIKQLPPEISSFFLSDDSRYELEKSFFLYGIESDALASKVAMRVGALYIGEIKLRELPMLIGKETGLSQEVSFGLAYEINKRIFNRFPEYFRDSTALLTEWGRLKSAPVLSEDEAWKKVLDVEPWIAELENEKKAEAEAEQKKREEKLAALVKMKLPDALKKFEKLGEQHLSANPIKLKIFEAPVRPSIKNWISDYYEKLDARHHDSIERGNYLFHSDNARRLTTGERQKVGTMLRALDEGSEVTVDSQRQEIIFQTDAETGGQEISNVRNASPIRNDITTSGRPSGPSIPQTFFVKGEVDGMSFSSGQKFSSEIKRPAPAPRPVYQAPQAARPVSSFTPPAPRPAYQASQTVEAKSPAPASDLTQPMPKPQPQPKVNIPEYENFGFAQPKRQTSQPSNNVVDLREQ